MHHKGITPYRTACAACDAPLEAAAGIWGHPQSTPHRSLASPPHTCCPQWMLPSMQLDSAYDLLTSIRPCGPKKHAIRCGLAGRGVCLCVVCMCAVCAGRMAGSPTGLPWLCAWLTCLTPFSGPSSWTVCVSEAHNPRKQACETCLHC